MPRTRTLLLALALSLVAAACAGDATTAPEAVAPGAPSLDGTGWLGGGGRSDSTSVSTTSDSSSVSSTPVEGV